MMQSKSFQLEQTVPGSFFFQGVAGGMLSGFIFVLLVGLLVQDFHPGWAIPLTPVYMMMGAVVGTVQATLIWGAYRITLRNRTITVSARDFRSGMSMLLRLASVAQVRILSEGVVGPGSPVVPLPYDLVPTRRFTTNQIRSGLPKPGPFGAADLRWCS